MASSNATVTALKVAFLQTQVNQFLSKPVEPSERALRPPVNGQPLPHRLIHDATQKVNRRLQDHSKNVWGSITVRKVAEQIDWVYWDSTEPENQMDQDESSSNGLYVEDDLSLEGNIAKLPDFLESLPATGSSNLSVELDRLHELSTRRKTLLQKLRVYEEITSLLQPFQEPQSSIQPNLVTKGGALVTELSKLRTLTVRLAGRLSDGIDTDSVYQNIPVNTGDERDEIMEDEPDLWKNDEDGKLSKVLAHMHPQ